MVKKFQSPVRVYKYPFELVMKAYERRFPTCPQIPIVLETQIIKDEEKDGGAIRNTSRRCTIAVDVPYLFKKLIGLDSVFFIQHNYLDMRARTLNIEAVNETFSNRVEIFERCRYYPHPENPDWTCFDQVATLDIKSFFGFESAMEKIGMKQYTQTTLKGKEIMEYFIGELRKDGITHIDRWPEAESKESSELEKEHSDSFGSRKPSIKEYEEMLDGDYIFKHLGTLEPIQESQILELHDKIKVYIDDGSKLPPYTTLLRFLRACDFNVDKAFQMLKDSLKWRKDNNIDQMLEEYKKPTILNTYFPGAWHHFDKAGRPLYVLRLGHMDIKGLVKTIGDQALLDLAFHICEEGLKACTDASNSREEPVLNWSLLCDLEGLSMRHLWRPGLKVLFKIIEIVENNYPETMGKVFITRAPIIFPIAWTIVSTFINENTRSKFLFLGGTDSTKVTEELEPYIDANKIPNFLGGTCETRIHESGLIPKSLYRTSCKENEENPSAKDTEEHHNIYQSAELKPSEFHELIIHNSDPSSVLTWDFDVLNGSLVFNIYRTGSELPENNDASKSVLELAELKEGKCYYRVEPSLECKKTESVQGSHVMKNTETYILQWKCISSNEELSKLLYFHEILPSAKYRGSLLNINGGNSTISLASSHQSR